MRYVSKKNPEQKFTVKEVKKDTSIEHPEYGTILVTAGNYLITRSNGDDKGETLGITAQDLEAKYELVDKK